MDTLNVRVVEGQAIAAPPGKSIGQPFVVISVSGTRQRTPVCPESTDTPEWNCTLPFTLKSADDTLMVEVWGETPAEDGQTAIAQFIGCSMNVSLQRAFETGRIDCGVHVFRKNGTYSGAVHLDIRHGNATPAASPHRPQAPPSSVANPSQVQTADGAVDITKPYSHIPSGISGAPTVTAGRQSSVSMDSNVNVKSVGDVELAKQLAEKHQQELLQQTQQQQQRQLLAEQSLQQSQVQEQLSMQHRHQQQQQQLLQQLHQHPKEEQQEELQQLKLSQQQELLQLTMQHETAKDALIQGLFKEQEEKRNQLKVIHSEQEREFLENVRRSQAEQEQAEAWRRHHQEVERVQQERLMLEAQSGLNSNNTSGNNGDNTTGNNGSPPRVMSVQSRVMEVLVMPQSPTPPPPPSSPPPSETPPPPPPSQAPTDAAVSVPVVGGHVSADKFERELIKTLRAEISLLRNSVQASNHRVESLERQIGMTPSPPQANVNEKPRSAELLGQLSTAAQESHNGGGGGGGSGNKYGTQHTAGDFYHQPAVAGPSMQPQQSNHPSGDIPEFYSGLLEHYRNGIKTNGPRDRTLPPNVLARMYPAQLEQTEEKLVPLSNPNGKRGSPALAAVPPVQDMQPGKQMQFGEFGAYDDGHHPGASATLRGNPSGPSAFAAIDAAGGVGLSQSMDAAEMVSRMHQAEIYRGKANEDNTVAWLGAPSSWRGECQEQAAWRPRYAVLQEQQRQEMERQKSRSKTADANEQKDLQGESKDQDLVSVLRSTHRRFEWTSDYLGALKAQHLSYEPETKQRALTLADVRALPSSAASPRRAVSPQRVVYTAVGSTGLTTTVVPLPQASPLRLQTPMTATTPAGTPARQIVSAPPPSSASRITTTATAIVGSSSSPRKNVLTVESMASRSPARTGTPTRNAGRSIRSASPRTATIRTTGMRAVC